MRFDPTIRRFASMSRLSSSPWADVSRQGVEKSEMREWMAKPDTAVWNFMINEVLFELIVDALAVFQKEQHRLSGLVPMMMDYLQSGHMPDEQMAASIVSLGPLTGRIRLSLRLPAGDPRLAQLREILSELIGKPCTIREIVALAALSRT